MKKNNKKGFTLAELLIVVAIIAVLTAIAIPVFTTQLEKAREATDMANLRSAYAECTAEALTADTATHDSVCKNVEIKQTTAGWVTADVKIGEVDIKTACEPKSGDKVLVTVFCDGSAAKFEVNGTAGSKALSLD